jgi:hypothetical protein
LIEFVTSAIRKQRTGDFKAAVESASEAALAAHGWLVRDPLESIMAKAGKERWAEVDDAVVAAKTRHRRILDGLVKATETVERAWLLDHDYGNPATKYDPALRRAVKEYRRKHPSPIRITAAGSRADPVALLLDTVSNEMQATWTKMLRRTAYLDHVLAVARFNHPGRGSVGKDDIDALLNRALPGLRARLADGATFAAATWADGHATGAARMLPQALAEARKALKGTADERIAAAERIRSLQWLLAALRMVQWRCLWPIVGDGEALVEAARLPIAPDGGPTLKALATLARRQPADGAAVATAGRVSELIIRHERNKAITRFRLVNADGSASVLVKATGFKADSTGLVNGADTEVAGTWRRGSGEGELLLGRAALVARAKASFDGFLESELRGIWLRVPHSLSLRFGWVEGYDGPINPVRYLVGHAG